MYEIDYILIIIQKYSMIKDFSFLFHTKYLVSIYMLKLVISLLNNVFMLILLKLILQY